MWNKTACLLLLVVALSFPAGASVGPYWRKALTKLEERLTLVEKNLIEKLPDIRHTMDRLNGVVKNHSALQTRAQQLAGLAAELQVKVQELKSAQCDCHEIQHRLRDLENKTES